MTADKRVTFENTRGETLVGKLVDTCSKVRKYLVSAEGNLPYCRILRYQTVSKSSGHPGCSPDGFHSRLR